MTSGIGIDLQKRERRLDRYSRFTAVCLSIPAKKAGLAGSLAAVEAADPVA